MAAPAAEPLTALPADSMSRPAVTPARRQAGRAAAAASVPGAEEKIAAPSVVAGVDIAGTLTAALKPMAAPAPTPMSAAPMPRAADQTGEVAPQDRLAGSSRMASDSTEAREAPPRVAANDQVSSARAKIAAAPSRAESAPAEARAGDEAPQEPQAWLLKIESMHKAGRPKEALDEWHGFRRTYPGYAVPKELRARLDALQDGGQPP
ncbi:MAG TPA: hypothetical protein DCW29_21330 [Janthinobacterium sp.]|nr:hypothetical protein [Janthinobacterium sp.]